MLLVLLSILCMLFSVPSLAATKLEGLMSKLSNYGSPAKFELHEACKNNNLKALDQLIASGKNVNQCDRTGMTPLMYAARCSLPCVAALVAAGANIDTRNNMGFTALYWAVLSDQYPIAAYLLNRAASVDSTIEGEPTPLCHACYAGTADIARLLINYNANVNYATRTGETPLSILITCKEPGAWIGTKEDLVRGNEVYGWLKIVDALIEHGASVDWRNKDGDGLLSIASRLGQLELVKRLIEAGAKMDELDRRGNTALQLAIIHDHYELATYLLERGAAIDVPTGGGFTALHYACYSGSVDIVRLLIKHGANVNHLSKERCSPLNTLLMGENIFKQSSCTITNSASNSSLVGGDNWSEVVKELLGNGCKVNLADQNGNSPLFAACRLNRFDLVKQLVDAGSNVNCKNEKGFTALIWAAHQNYAEIANYLLLHGAVVDLADKDEMTPLYHACYKGSVQIIKLLLSYQANINHQTKSGSTPLQALLPKRNHSQLPGLSAERVEAIQYLISNRANVNLFSQNGDSPLIIATKLNQLDIVKQLVGAGANINWQNPSKLNALFWAVAKDLCKVAEYFLLQGANINLIYDDQYSLLHCACYRGNVRIVRMLIKHKANVNQQTSSGDTPLNILIRNREVCLKDSLEEQASCKNLIETSDEWDETAKLLLASKADPTISNSMGNSSLMAASQLGWYNLVRWLVEVNGDLNGQNIKGETALGEAAYMNQHHVVNYLIQRGALVNLANKAGFSPLHRACSTGALESIEVLVKNKANVNQQTTSGDCPLHVLLESSRILKPWCEGGVSESKWILMVKVLIKHGANINAHDSFGDTVSIIASRTGYLSLVKQLTEAGANIYAKNQHGLDLLCVALLQGQYELVEYLLSKLETSMVMTMQTHARENFKFHYLVDGFIKFFEPLARKDIDKADKIQLLLALLYNQLGKASELLKKTVLTKEYSDNEAMSREKTFLMLLKSLKLELFRKQIFEYYIQPKRFDSLMLNDKNFLRNVFHLPMVFIKASANVPPDGMTPREKMAIYSKFAHSFYQIILVMNETLKPIKESKGLTNLEFLIYLFGKAMKHLSLQDKKSRASSGYRTKVLSELFKILFNGGDYEKLIFLCAGVLNFFKARLDRSSMKRQRFFDQLITWYPFAVGLYLETPEYMVDLIWAARLCPKGGRGGI